MKKWSIISSLVVFAALAVAALAIAGPASAANPYEPHCPNGEEGTPPYCYKPPSGGGSEQPKTCPGGQVGTYPNCVTPALRLNHLKVGRIRAVITATVNAPGTLVANGGGLFTAHSRTVNAGSYKLGMRLRKGKLKQLNKKGKVKVWVKVAYRPTGAAAIIKHFPITFRSKRHQKRHTSHHKAHNSHKKS